MTEPVTLINAFEVPPGADGAFITAWNQARDQLSVLPGYGGATLHRALQPNTRFRYVNMGQWQTPGHFRAATATAGIRADAFPFPAHPGLYQAVAAEQRLTNGQAKVTLINPFEVPPADDHKFIASWDAAREYLSRQPGYLDTTLYRAVEPGAGFRYVNIAHWTSADAFTSAVADPAFRATAPVRYPASPALYQPLAG
jgi:heme-degrading monooxygenase HmoA